MTKFAPLLLLILAVAMLAGCKKSDLPEYPAEIKEGIQLPSSNSDEEIRYVTYSQDGTRTPVFMRVDYRNGNTAFATYHPNGKVKEWKEFYAGPEKEGPRQLRLRIVLSPREHYKEDQLYRADGTLARAGREVNRAYYDASWYREDGKTVERRKQMRLDAERTVQLDEKFRPNATMESKMVLLPDGKRITTGFSEAGVATWRWNIAARYGEWPTYEAFREDGTTVKYKAEYQPLSQYVEYYRLDGTVEMARLHQKMYGELQVLLKNEKGEMLFRQNWRFAPDGNHLLRVIFDHKNGQLREIRLHRDGKMPMQISTVESIRTFRSDGTLEKEQSLDANKRVVETKTFTREQNIREDLPAHYLVDPPHEEAPPATPADMPIVAPTYPMGF